MKSKNEQFISLLLEWFQLNKRDFSWRNRVLSPFQQLIAELMLQKTNANQVEKVFPKFIKDYPDAKNVADLEEKKLVEIFQPLGLFNRRARDLKKIAQKILENGNEVPCTKKELMDLPGVGEYIANAVMCFAFNQPVPIVDANVGRVIKRAYSFPVKNAPSRDKKLLEKMEQIIPKTEYKEFNYAILDLAALICIPKNPKCNECSLLKICDHGQKI